MKEKKKVVVAMSGGVDSGVAAALLVEQGYDVVGLHLRLWKDPTSPRCSSGLRGAGGLNEEAARKTAKKLGVPFYVKDYSEDFKEIVVDYFLAEYAAGRTPNPCVVCNQFIKFGKLLEDARALGCDYLATGHYARISSSAAPLEVCEDNVAARPWRARLGVGDDRQTKGLQLPSSPPVYHLLKGVDDSKDQSYFLWTLTQEKLAHILFPVGDRKKSEVKKLVRVRNLPVSERPESFEVCFILDDDYRDFLKRHIPGAIKPGEVVNTEGEIIGRHFGLPLYTVGQRKGFEVQSSVPLYVVGKNLEKNQLVVGRGGESERQKFAVSGVNWISGQAPKDEVNCQVRVRYQGELLRSQLIFRTSHLAEVALAEAILGITPGQSAVFYDGEEVLGGGVIEKSQMSKLKTTTQNPQSKTRRI
jgi:tRNA-specific 2-thiouridylase